MSSYDEVEAFYLKKVKEDMQHKGNMVIAREFAKIRTELHFANEKLQNLSPLFSVNPALSNVYRDRRKIVSIGQNSSGITLDSDFIKMNNLSTKDKVDVIVLTNSIVHG